MCSSEKVSIDIHKAAWLPLVEVAVRLFCIMFPCALLCRV